MFSTLLLAANSKLGDTAGIMCEFCRSVSFLLLDWSRQYLTSAAQMLHQLVHGSAADVLLLASHLLPVIYGQVEVQRGLVG